VADTTLGFSIEAGQFELERTHAQASADDLALIEGLRVGAEAAYEILISRFEHSVYSIVSRLLDQPEDAADVVQDVFIKIFRNVDHFRGESSLKTWVYRIAVNEARNQRRWFGRHRKQEVDLEAAVPEAHGLCDVLPDPGRSPFELALDRETRALIEDALATVPGSYRTALVLREVEGLSYEEIGAILSISLGTVKSRILRGRDALRRAIAAKLEPSGAPANGTEQSFSRVKSV
jgi:RNA polymerase sigma-70 factor (ECF subfamily)